MREEDIRKRAAFNEYLKLVAKDVKNLFDFNSFEKIQCPACNSHDFVHQFDKMGFKYVCCKNCATLFVNPRPPIEDLKKFYTNSPSTNFWINEFFKPVAAVRREKIFKPRAEYIKQIFSTNTKKVIGDIGAGFGLFLEELRKIRPDDSYIAIEPSLEMAEICHRKGLEVKNACLEDINDMKESFDLLTAFELVEHLFDPTAFFKKAYFLLKPRGHIVITTLNSQGFDILLLWGKSKSITPPHHLNFFNPYSAKKLLDKIGFEIIEISTPGKLDWDIVEGMIKNEGVDLGRFWDLLVKEGSQEGKKDLQDWISKNGLSSHVRILARKPSSL